MRYVLNKPNHMLSRPVSAVSSSHTPPRHPPTRATRAATLAGAPSPPPLSRCAAARASRWQGQGCSGGGARGWSSRSLRRGGSTGEARLGADSWGGVHRNGQGGARRWRDYRGRAWLGGAGPWHRCLEVACG